MNKKLLEYFKGNELAAEAWLNKYATKEEETPVDMHYRLAIKYAEIELDYINKIENLEDKITLLSSYGQTRLQDILYSIFDNKNSKSTDINTIAYEYIYPLFKDFRFIIPGGSVMANLGTDTPTSLSNCFVLGQPGDNIESIFNHARDQSQLYKRRGGVGTDLSLIRPRGAVIDNAAKTTAGVIPFMELYSTTTNIIGQEGRRGASMLSLDVRHPDILEFINSKQDLTKITGANISIKTNKEFMDAVENDADYILRWPIETDVNKLSKKDIVYNELKFFYSKEGSPYYIKKVKAKEIWDAVIQANWKSAEPGILFWDNHLKNDPSAVYDEYKPISTNPCGEIPLQPKDSCRLSAVNLYSLVLNPFTEDAELDTDLAYEIFYEQAWLSDNLVDLEIQAIDKILHKINPEYDNTCIKWYKKSFLMHESSEFKLWYSIKQIGANSRRVGNGFTALADMFAALNLKYGSKESKELLETLMTVKLKAELDATIDLSIMRGSFVGWNFTKEFEHTENGLLGKNQFYSMLAAVYPEDVSRMYLHGRRNVSFSTIAPTGTVSLLAQTSSGIEPVFQPYYVRRMKVSTKEESSYKDVDGQYFKEFIVVHPKLKEFALGILNISDKEMNNYKEEDWNNIYINSPYHNACSSDVNWQDRLEIQQIVQNYTTHSISSTINVSKDTAIDTINKIYKKAYDLGLKGITIYRDGSRGGILVDTKQINTKFVTNRAPKRPKVLDADVHIVNSEGIRYVVLVGLYENKPYEVFVYDIPKDLKIKAKKGQIIKVKKRHYKFVSGDYICENIHDSHGSNMEKKATALFVSMLLRTGADIKFIIKTAKKVDDNITSFTSAMSRVLSKYVKKEIIHGEICPDCSSSIIREAGCEKCTNCTYSKCLMIHKS